MIPNAYNPDFCDFHYRRDFMVSDVNTILASLTAQLVTAPAAAHKWTEAPAGTFLNPSGHLKLAFSRIAADQIECIAYNKFGIVIATRRMNIETIAPWREVRYYTGTYYCFIDSYRSTPETMIGVVLDPAPDIIDTDLVHPAFFSASRDSAGNGDGLGAYPYLYGFDNTTWATFQRLPKLTDVGGTSLATRSPVQRFMYRDVWVSQSIGGARVWAGRFPQALLGPYWTPCGMEKKVPITDGLMATFEATSWTDGSYDRLFMRKA